MRESIVKTALIVIVCGLHSMLITRLSLDTARGQKKDTRHLSPFTISPSLSLGVGGVSPKLGPIAREAGWRLLELVNKK